MSASPWLAGAVQQWVIRLCAFNQVSIWGRKAACEFHGEMAGLPAVRLGKGVRVKQRSLLDLTRSRRKFCSAELFPKTGHQLPGGFRGLPVIPGGDLQNYTSVRRAGSNHVFGFSGLSPPWGARPR